jgi:hypothetical protein
VGLDRLIAKALGISDEEIVEATMSPEQRAVIEGAEQALEIAKRGGGCADCGEEVDDSAYVEIAKRDFSPEERQKARFSLDGRFPMDNCSDVMNARQALGRAKPEDRPKIKALISRAAEAMNCNVEKGVESNGGSATVGHMEKATGTVEENAGTLEERVADLEASIEELPDKIAKAISEAKEEGKGEETSPEDLSAKLDTLATETADAVKDLGEKIEKLGAGGSSQEPDPKDEDQRSEAIAKAYKDRDLSPDLAGILS